MKSNAGGSTLQQALTLGAATVVKEAVTLARRRGHAQVTPLHVASTMLSSSSSSDLLRAACQQSHTHPLQCRALELCFNVALNRLPTIASSSPPISPMLGSLYQQQSQSPGISNALVAAFKRAQAHQRRGGSSVENQQQQNQALMAIKIEVEQLVVSILDDPSVSRVMKEAGFSSTLVKAKVQQSVVDINTRRDAKNNMTSGANKKPSNQNKSGGNKLTGKANTTTILGSLSTAGVLSRSDEPRRRMTGHQVTTNEDVMTVIEGLATAVRMGKSRSSSCVVVVGECLATLEGLVEEAICTVERGDSDIPEPLREVKFVPLHLDTVQQLTKEGIERKVEEIKSIANRTYVEKGVVFFYLGDLDRWACSAKLRVDSGGHDQVGYYCHVEHMIKELRRLVLEYCNDDDSVRLWLLGAATFQRYTSKKKKSTQSCGEANSDSEDIWGTSLHAITIQATGSFWLTHLPDHSEQQCSSTGQRVQGSHSLVHEGIKEDDKIQKNGCKSEPAVTSSTTNLLPSWLQKCINNKDYQQETADVTVTDKSERWICSPSADSSICNSSPLSSNSHCFQRTLSFASSIYPPSSGSHFCYGHLNFQHTHGQTVQQCGNFWSPGGSTTATDRQLCSNAYGTSTFKTYIPDTRDQTQYSPLSPITPNYSTTSSTEIMENYCSTTPMLLFKEHNTVENLRTICNALERKVPWQKDIIQDIVSTILHCRVRMTSLDDHHNPDKEETWLFFQGTDMEGKQEIARELAGLFFGSREKFVSIGISSFSSSPRDAAGSAEEYSTNKRSRAEWNSSYLERLGEAVSTDPHRVFFLEDIEQVDYCSQVGIKRAAERGKLRRSSSDTNEVGFGDAIIILSCCERFRSRSRGCSPNMNHLLLDDHGGTIAENQEEKSTTVDGFTSPSLSLDLNLSICDDHCSTSVVQCDDDCHDLSSSLDEIGLVASVDKCVVFKLREL